MESSLLFGNYPRRTAEAFAFYRRYCEAAAYLGGKYVVIHGQPLGHGAWSDREYWPEARPYEAAYLHKFCVRRAFTHTGMTGRVVEALRQECAPRGVRFLRLDTGADEPVVRDIYLKAGFQIVKTLCDHATPSMLLYELEL